MNLMKRKMKIKKGGNMLRWFKKLVKKWAKEVYKEDRKEAVPMTGRGLDESYMYDFHKGWQSGSSGGIVMGESLDSSDNGSKKKKSIKIAIKPIDVLHELERSPHAFDLNNLDDKIELLKLKAELIDQTYSKRHVNKLVERLENRKVYPKYTKYFSQFQDTTEEKINVLIEKHDLVMKSSELFVPSFPEEAVKIMTEYSKKVQLVCKKQSVFYVIAEKADFREKDDKLDPILLVQSPFGFYYQILGAWDKTMILLSEL